MNNNQVFNRIDFQKITPSDLHPLAILPQALDNQWIPTSLLKTIIAKRQNYSDIEIPLNKRRRIEYLRSLTFSPQIIMSRASLFNNPIIYDDFTKSDANRETFQTFIETGTIVPFLLFESSPVESPSYDTNEKSFTEWRRIASNTQITCLRLSWDDDTNRSAVHNLILKRFEQSMLNISLLNTEFLSELFEFKDRDIKLFNSKLSEISRFCRETLQEGRSITRSSLYVNFVVTPRSNSVDGHFYDVPFSYVIKQIIDTNYNLAISNAVERLSLVPSDTLPITIPQQFDKHLSSQYSHFLNADDIKKMISPLLEEVLRLSTLSFSSLENMEIQSVHKVRQTSDWNYFILKIQELFDNPFSVSMLASGIFTGYSEVSKIFSRLSKKPDQQTWQPSLELRINISGTIIKITWLNGERPFFFVSGNIPRSQKSAIVYMSIAINDEQNLNSDMSFGVTFIKAVMDEPAEQLDLLIEMLSKFAVQQETSETSIKKGVMLAATLTPFSWDSA